MLTGHLHLQCYSDASFANMRDCKSRRIHNFPGIVVGSTLAAETSALFDCVETAVFLSNVFDDIVGNKLKINCFVEN